MFRCCVQNQGVWSLVGGPQSGRGVQHATGSDHRGHGGGDARSLRIQSKFQAGELLEKVTSTCKSRSCRGDGRGGGQLLEVGTFFAFWLYRYSNHHLAIKVTTRWKQQGSLGRTSRPLLVHPLLGGGSQNQFFSKGARLLNLLFLYFFLIKM